MKVSSAAFKCLTLCSAVTRQAIVNLVRTPYGKQKTAVNVRRFTPLILGFHNEINNIVSMKSL